MREGHSGQRRSTAHWMLVAVVVVAAVFVVPAFFGREEPGPPAPPPHQDSPVVVIYGDSQSNHRAHRDIVREIRSRRPVTVFHTGDLVKNGRKPKQWKTFFDITRELMAEAEFFPALGNHDENSPLYFVSFDLPNNERWYSVDRIGIHFVVLDTNSPITPSSEQHTWLREDLKASAGTTKFSVVVMHHPPYSTGPMPEDEMGLRSAIVPLIEAHGVDLVFAGHDHAYERSEVNEVVYVVSGGGGAPLFRQKRSSSISKKYARTFHFCEMYLDEGMLVVRAIDRAGRLVDEFAVSGKP